MKNWKKPILFCIGGGTYVGLELLYRRRSHISMFAAGGSCFLLLGRLGKSKLPSWSKPLFGTAIITTVELATGLLFNRRFTVWDYRDQPGNYRGQICLPFCLLWLPLSIIGMSFYRLVDDRLP